MAISFTFDNLVNSFTRQYEAAIQTSKVASAAIIQGQVARRAPVDTGHLRQSITALVGNDVIVGPGSADAITPPPDGEVAVGSSVSYAREQELYGKQGFEGRAYFARGLDASTNRIIQVFRQQLGRIQ